MKMGEGGVIMLENELIDNCFFLICPCRHQVNM